MREFGQMLKEWRGIRRFSQLNLALEADMSARHLSFLESGRANPSKAMVLRLSQALEMPKIITNQALNAAGFSAAFPEIALDSPDLAPVRKAVDVLLERHDPFPGATVDRRWNILEANAGCQMLIALSGISEAPNLMEILLSAASGGLIENWEEVAYLSLVRLRSEIAEYGGDEKLSELAERIANHERLINLDISGIDLDQAVIPTILNTGDLRLSLFSMVAQFGSVQDVRCGEMRVELMFPSDQVTANWFAEHVMV